MACQSLRICHLNAKFFKQPFTPLQNVLSGIIPFFVYLDFFINNFPAAL